MAGKPKPKNRYVQHDRHGHERIIVPDTTSSDSKLGAPVIINNSTTTEEEDSDSGRQDEGRTNKTTKPVSAEDAIEQMRRRSRDSNRRRRSRDEPRRRVYRHNYSPSAVDSELGMVTYGAEPVYTQHTTTSSYNPSYSTSDEQREREKHEAKYQARLEADLRKAGASEDLIAARLKEESTSQDARRAATMVTAGVGLSAGLNAAAIKAKAEAQKAKLQAEQGQKSSKPTDTSEPSRNERDEKLERERIRREKRARQYDEIHRRPEMSSYSADHRSRPKYYYSDEVRIIPATSTGNRRARVSYYDDDRERERRRRLRERGDDGRVRESEEFDRHELERRRLSFSGVDSLQAGALGAGQPALASRLRDSYSNPSAPSAPLIAASGLVIRDSATTETRRSNERDMSRSRSRTSALITRGRPIILDERQIRRRQDIGEVHKVDEGYERDDIQTKSLSPAQAEDSEPTISDFSSMSGALSEDEGSTLVEDRTAGEELHLSQQEAQAMMMNFLATFTTVPA